MILVLSYFSIRKKNKKRRRQILRLIIRDEGSFTPLNLNVLEFLTSISAERLKNDENITQTNKSFKIISTIKFSYYLFSP
jgi:hypothetical protein